MKEVQIFSIMLGRVVRRTQKESNHGGLQMNLIGITENHNSQQVRCFGRCWKIRWDSGFWRMLDVHPLEIYLELTDRRIWAPEVWYLIGIGGRLGLSFSILRQFGTASLIYCCNHNKFSVSLRTTILLRLSLVNFRVTFTSRLQVERVCFAWMTLHAARSDTISEGIQH